MPRGLINLQGRTVCPSVVDMEAAGFSEMLVPPYTKQHCLHIHCHGT